MKTILVDDELLMLELFEEECKDIPEINIVGKFNAPEKALAYAEENRVDLAFLDIEMPKLNGLDLSDELRDLYPDIIIIFVSAYDQHMCAALKEHDADWFLLKPYTSEEVLNVVNRAKLLSERQRKRVEIKTFGNFEVFVDGAAVKFRSPKAKEILALLVDRRGDSLTAQEGFNEMWPDLVYNHTEGARYRIMLRKLQDTLKNAGIEYILKYLPNARALDCSKVDCDYFAMLDRDMDAIRKYNGGYMTQYAWSEDRIPLLNLIKEKNDAVAAETMYI